MSNIVQKLRDFFTRYVEFTDEDTSLVVALWVIGTYLWARHFDAYGYLVVTSDTKRSGKTRLGIDLMSFVANTPQNFAAATPAALFRSIESDRPTVLVDEAERFSSEKADVMRQVMNAGYRAGQTVRRTSGDAILIYNVYSPKVFVLIGDVNDTLRDRSIVVRLRRAEQAPEFRYRVAEREGAELRAELQELFTTVVTDPDTNQKVRVANTDAAEAIGALYQSFPFKRLAFLSDRDAEIWQSLFSIAQCLGVDNGLERIAIDIATEKTAEARRYVDLRGAEDSTQEDGYAKQLLADVRTVLGNRKQMFTKDILDALYAIPTAPWRKLRGVGLNPNDLGNTLARFGVKPKVVRVGGRKMAPARGYTKADIDKAATVPK